MSQEQTHFCHCLGQASESTLAGFDVPPWVNGYGQECGGPQARRNRCTGELPAASHSSLDSQQVLEDFLRTPVEKIFGDEYLKPGNEFLS